MGDRGAFLRHALPLGRGGQAREGCESVSTEGVTSVLSHSEV